MKHKRACLDSKTLVFLEAKPKKVKLTILSDKLCKEIGNVDADNLGNQQIVNTRKELCGAFVNEINVTFVNYTFEEKTHRYSLNKL